MHAWRTLSRRPTLASININYHKTIGHRLRDFIENVGTLIHPVVKHVFPNFIAVHYFYIISMAILGSILMYPVKNFSYIDILFMSAGAATQGGLNTINTNDMTLYQQIVIYSVCCLTTPIWIHGSLAFVRLYWFERYFDGIKDWSKKNFKMRRTKTLIQREMTRTATENQRRQKSSGRADNDFQSKLFSGQMINREEQGDSGENYEMESLKDAPPASPAHKELHTSLSTGSTKNDQDDSPAIKFGDMPKPHKSAQMPSNIEHFSGRRRSEDINPADMYRSIAMLQERPYEEEDEAGPALVIKGPAERRSDPASSAASINGSLNHERPKVKQNMIKPESAINSPHLSSSSSEVSNLNSTQQRDGVHESADDSSPAIQFEIKNPPSSQKKPVEKSSSTGQRLKSKFMKDLAHRSRLRQRLRRVVTNTDDDGNDADLEPESSPNVSESDDGIDDPEGFNGASVTSSDLPSLEKVQSTLAMPSEDATGGSKFHKRSLTMEAPGNANLELLTKSPSFQKMIYNRWKNERRHKGGFIRSAYRRPSPKRSRSEHNLDFSPRSFQRTITDEPSIGGIPDEDYYGMTFEEPVQRPRLKRMSTNYLSWQPKVGRNSTFVGMSDIQRAELGGVEYRAIKLLCKLIVFFYFGFHILGIVMLMPWITQMKEYINIVREDGVSPAWWGFFTSMSSFNDLGITLTPDSMVSFNKAIYPLIVMMWFIVIGNTGFPIFLRFIIWVMFKVSPELSLVKESLGFLLDHPRRCFTLLFPSAPTWWLLFILVALNVIDLILFIVLDLNSKVVEGLSSGFKVLNGLFQAVSTRTAGFTILNLSKLHPSVQVSYMLMMYVSVLPLAISIRRTNVYEEQSLGVYSGGNHGEGHEELMSDDQSGDETSRKNTKSFIGAHLRRQLSFDLWFLFLGLFIICISEGGKIQDTSKPDFTVFQVLFEIVSAYGTVGLSLGYPNTDQSFSAQFNTFSKVVIIAMLIRGRHRGLPYSLDRAIILPSQSLERRDQLEDMKHENDSAPSKDPLVAYLRRQSKSAKGQMRSILRSRRRTSGTGNPSLRTSVDYNSTPRNSGSAYDSLSPRSRSVLSDRPVDRPSSSPSPHARDLESSDEDLNRQETDADAVKLSDEPPTANQRPIVFTPSV